MEWNQKIYVISRRDLKPGAQACQAMHALREFAHKHPVLEREWYEISNHVCFLSVSNELELVALMREANLRGIMWASFQEPDFGMEYTAICLEPSSKSREICAFLTLGLSEYSGLEK